jgi:hypothetical protein
MTEKIPIELCELIKERPEITYLMLRMTTKYLFISREQHIEDDEIDQVIWNFLNTYEIGEMSPEYNFDDKEIN